MQWKNPDGSLTGGVVIEDGAGNKLGTLANPLNVTGGGGGGGGSNASVGSTGLAVPTSATAIGFQDISGNLVLPTPSAGLPVADSGVKITGASMPAGGVGLTGWLSAIWSKLSGTLAVSGTFWQATQPVSAASLPLPTGAATAALQTSMITALGAPVQAGATLPTTETYANVAGVSPVTVGQSAQLIVAARAGRKEVTLILETAVAVRVGGSNVGASTNGVLLQGVAGEAITISGGAALYGYAPTGSASVSALEVY